MDKVETQRFLSRQRQAACSLALLAVLLSTCIVTELLARNRILEQWITAKSSELAKENGALFSYTGNFIDFEDRVLLDEQPQADYSRGGVYFFGTSNMKWAFSTWDLPADDRQLIGNYGIGASNHTTQLQMIRYLIQQRGFLAARDRDLLVFGVSFHLGHVDEPPGGFFASLLRRHGLFKITPDNRVEPASMSTIERWLRVEKARSGGFIWNLGRLAKSWGKAFGGWAHRAHDKAKYQQAWREYMGPRWRQDIDSEVEQLRATISLVRSYGAAVQIILLPQGTWMDELPFKPYYEAKIRALCRESATPLNDLSRAIPDEDFVDSNHLTVQGQDKFRDLIIGNIIRHLEKIKQAELSGTRH
jgi:hypothetical protein